MAFFALPLLLLAIPVGLLGAGVLALAHSIRTVLVLAAMLAEALGLRRGLA